jgi:alpha-L-fucosidase
MTPWQLLAAITLCTSFLVGCSDPSATQQRSRQMPEWYDDAKLGIFIHWGLPSVPAYAAGKAFKPGELAHRSLENDGGSNEGSYEMPYSEWYLFSLQDPQGKTRAYHDQTYGSDTPYQAFQPIYESRVAENWRADEWASLFRAAGAQYVVLVSKHHDGYALWPSKVSNPHRQGWYNQQDLVGELGEAVRDQNMKYGLYYSTGLDWVFKLSSDGGFFENFLRSAPPGQDYGDYVYAHLTELIDQYQPDLLWADIGYPSKGNLDNLLAYYFEQVPDGVINDRWEQFDFLGKVAEYPGGAWILKQLARWSINRDVDPLIDNPARYGFKTEEYANLPGIPDFKWESTRGLGGSFGFNQLETADDMLSGTELIHYVIDTVSKNGNVLINVGPDSYGQIPAIQQQPLLELGDWLKTNGEAIYGTRPWSSFGGRSSEGTQVRYTRKGNTLYATTLDKPQSMLSLPGPITGARNVSLLGYGPVAFELLEDGIQIQTPDVTLTTQSAYTFSIALE